MAKRQILSTKDYIEILRLSTTNPTKNGGELRCSGRESSSCSTSVTIVLLLLKLLQPVSVKQMQNVSSSKSCHIMYDGIYHLV